MMALITSYNPIWIVVLDQGAVAEAGHPAGASHWRDLPFFADALLSMPIEIPTKGRGGAAE